MDLPIRRGGLDCEVRAGPGAVLAKIAGPRRAGHLPRGRARRGRRAPAMGAPAGDGPVADGGGGGGPGALHRDLARGARSRWRAREIRLEGLRDGGFTTLAQGTTEADGSWTMPAPLAKRPRWRRRRPAPHRGDQGRPTRWCSNPAAARSNMPTARWSKPDTPWLGWTASDVGDRRPAPQTLCHVFTERPIYRPEEPVLIAGMIRRYEAGALSLRQRHGRGDRDRAGRPGVAPAGDAGRARRLPRASSTPRRRRPATTPSSISRHGRRRALRRASRSRRRRIGCRRSRSVLHGPDRTPLDAPFSVDLLARFFAGGLLSERPITVAGDADAVCLDAAGPGRLPVQLG